MTVFLNRLFREITRKGILVYRSLRNGSLDDGFQHDGKPFNSGKRAFEVCSHIGIVLFNEAVIQLSECDIIGIVILPDKLLQSVI